MKNAVMKRVNEGKDIKEIGIELCDGLKYPQRKIIEIIKEIKGKDYLNENKIRLHYRGGGGAGKPKAKKTELQNFAPQEEPNLSESDKFKIKFTELINECHDSQPNNWKKIILKCIEDKENESKGDAEFEITQACSLVHDKKFDALNFDELNEEKAEEILELLEPFIIKNKDILNEIRLSFKFGNTGTVSEIGIYKN